MSTVRTHFHVTTGWQFAFTALLKQYLHRKRSEPRSRDFKSPVTVTLIAAVAADTQIPLSVRTAVLVAYDGLLRPQDYTCSRAKSFVPLTTLLCEDVVWNASGFGLRIKHSKSDPYNKGMFQPFVARTRDKFCPVVFVRAYMAQAPLSHVQGQPFFVKHTSKGVSFVTPADITAALRKHAHIDGVPASSISARSLRSAGAYQMANHNQSWEAIRVRGRWAFDPSSHMVVMYARTGLDRLQQQADSRTIEGASRSSLWLLPAG